MLNTQKTRFLNRLNFLYENISSDISCLKITAFLTREPVKFADRESGEKLELKEGDRWGERLFDCAWMKFEGEMPRAKENIALKLDVNGEMFVADKDGSPVCGLTCKMSTFSESLGKPAKCFYILPKQFYGRKKISVWADCGLNDLFGRLKGEGKIACARIVKINPEIRELYYNFEHAYDWLSAVESGDENEKILSDALVEACDLLDENFEKNLKPASKCLEKVLYRKSARPRLEVSAIGHAHMDLAWLWPIRETKRKLARTFATALNLQERFSSYVYGASQPQGYLWMKEDYPKLYSRIKEAVKKGSIDALGAMWVEPDCNMPSGESFVRQILYGRKFFYDEFGIKPDYFWIPDSFGYSPQLPQILKKSGVKYFITQKLSWNMINKFPHHSFWWQGIDGSKVLAHMLPENTYNSPIAPRSLVKVEREYAQKDVSRNALIAFGIGDGGGGAGEEHIRRLLKNRKVLSLNKIKNRKVSAFLKDLERESENFPTWKGDLYLEKHQGTFTTQGKNKKHNRFCENLLRKAEWLGYACERILGERQDMSFLEPIEKEILLYQFHDILPGSSIERVYAESCARYEELEKLLISAIENFERKLSNYFGQNLLVNCNSWSGKFYKSGRVSNVPALGFSAGAGFKKVLKASAKPFVLENGKLRLEFSDSGEMLSLKEKDSGAEFFDAKKPSNVFMVYDDCGDAWDFGYGYRKNGKSKMECVSKKFFEKCGAAIAELKFRFGQSTLVERVVLEGESDEIKIEISLDWKSKRKMLRLILPLGFKAQKSVSEVAFGYYEREPNDVGKWRKARIETPAHQWVAMKNKKMFFALLNDSKYGYRLKENAVEACLLRCVPRPGEPLIFAADKSKNPTGDDVDFADVGRQNFKFSIFAKIGAFDVKEIAARARALNMPISNASSEKSAKKRDFQDFSLVEIDNKNIELAAMKPAQDGKSWIMRLVNLSGECEKARIGLKFVPKEALECDLAEIPVKNPQMLENLAFGAHEIKSFILRY